MKRRKAVRLYNNAMAVAGAIDAERGDHVDRATRAMWKLRKENRNLRYQLAIAETHAKVALHAADAPDKNEALRALLNHVRGVAK